MFKAYLFQNFGGRDFVHALWQTGLTWAPPTDSDVNGAAEHVAQYFAKWCRRIARTVHRHKEDAATRFGEAVEANAFRVDHRESDD